MPTGNPNKTVEHAYNASEWSVTVGGTSLPWTRLEWTYEQFHLPATFALEAPLENVDPALVIPDKPAEVIISHKGKPVFIGQVDQSLVKGNQSEMPEDMVTITGRDLSAKLFLNKTDTTPPQNKTASEVVTLWCRQAGFTDLSGIQATTDQIGDFAKHNYHQVRKGLNRHEVIFDLAEYEGYVFRVYGRKPYFGPAPGNKNGPTLTKVPLAYLADFNEYEIRKSHTNADVTVRVTGRSKKNRVSQEQGTGSILIERIVGVITPDQAKKMAVQLLQRAEAGLFRLSIPNIPGHAEWNDVLFEFAVTGIKKGIDHTFWTERVHQVLTQDTHLSDLTLYNKTIASR
jgi:hypothetical protein